MRRRFLGYPVQNDYIKISVVETLSVRISHVINVFLHAYYYLQIFQELVCTEYIRGHGEKPQISLRLFAFKYFSISHNIWD